MHVVRVDALKVRDDTEIDWKTLPDVEWNLWSAHSLQRRWLTMKRSIKGYEDMTHHGRFFPVSFDVASLTLPQRSWTSFGSRKHSFPLPRRPCDVARSSVPRTWTTTIRSSTPSSARTVVLQRRARVGPARCLDLWRENIDRVWRRRWESHGERACRKCLYTLWIARIYTSFYCPPPYYPRLPLAAAKLTATQLNRNPVNLHGH